MPRAKGQGTRRVVEPPSRRADFLLEIGTEELPAAYLDGAIQQLQQEAERLVRAAHLEWSAIIAFGTPRRLVVHIKELSAVQHTPPEEIRGPSKQAAFDAAGKPTQALRGFLKAKGGTLAQTAVVSTEKGDYVYLRKPSRQAPTKEMLPGLLVQLVGRIRFPKTMQWDESGLRFARPIRWILALYGSSTIHASVGRLRSSNLTQLDRPKKPHAVNVKNANHYFQLMSRQGILIDAKARQRRIQQLVEGLAKRQRGRPVPEIITHGLLDEVTALVEQPVSLVGQFDPRYLKLPREVLLASMAKYQRVFAIQSPSGRLGTSFVGILDGPSGQRPRVQAVYEHILNARLADSLLFWKQDNHRLDQADLRSVTFHEQLGSMDDKTQRLVQLSGVLAESWQMTPQERAHLERACKLSKADLTSTMVKEFPTLQGVIGKYYARDAGEPEDVALALEEQYLPQGERLPESVIGAALSVLDKFDTLAGYFGLGIEPTGDQDPFGLRRCAQGVVEVSWALHRPLALEVLTQVRARMRPFDTIPDAQRARILARIHAYVAERLYTFVWPRPIPGRDLIEAVLASPWQDLVDAMDRVRELQTLNGKGELLRAAKVVERTHNILKSATVQQAEVDAARFHEPLERRLWDRFCQYRDRVLRLIHAKSYADATTEYGEAFFEVLHEFFDRVLVNVPDTAIQQNRLALMRAINLLYTEHIADLSRLTILQGR